MKSFLLIISLLTLLYAGSGHAHETLDRVDDGTGEIGIDEKVGQSLPADLSFLDENGKDITLQKLLGKPVILTLVYYTCEHICPLMLVGLSQALPRLMMAAGRDYRVITISFDATDTPEIARIVKRNTIKTTGPASQEDGWKFLTGNQENIQKLTRSVGFRFRKEIHGFNHPVALIFLSPEGKISKYLQVTNYQYGAEYPIIFSSFDLNVSLTEAAQGKAVSGFKKAVLYCFSHEPPGQSKFFSFIAALGLVTLAAMATFFIYLQVSTRRHRKGKEYDAE
jgi:protein SCO1